jgi:uncharacterized protein (TIGR02421 family)
VSVQRPETDREENVTTRTAKLAPIIERIERGQGARHTFSKGGVLTIDRGLPYLIVYREPSGREDDGTERLVATEAAYLIGRRGEEDEIEEAVRRVAESGSTVYGAFLVLELWSSPDPTSRRLVVRAPDGPAPETVGKLVEALGSLGEIHDELELTIEFGDERQPAGLPPLLSVEESWQHEVLLLGLEVPPIYRDPESGATYPRYLRRLQHALSRALRQALYEFVRVQTSSKVQNHLALGTRTPPDTVWEVDRALCAIERSIDLLLLVSPVNGDAAWERFRAERFERNPEFHYRLLPSDPDLLKRRLFNLELETIDDPALADLLEDKRQELETQFTMLRERGAKTFRHSSRRLYGDVDDRLRATAEAVLEEVEPPARWRGEWVDADGFRRAAERELDYYRERHPAIRNTIEIRRDVSGLLVSAGNMLIGKDLRLRADRVEPLVHHEVGTHMLTYVNGSAQPLEQLALGLAHYDEFQEGLAVLAEHLAGGLDRLRMRLLAARVLAARSVQQDAEFVDTFRLLTRDYGYTPQGAWHIAVRVHASGGFTRDLIYLRGLLDLLELLQRGQAPRSLYIGKIAKKHLPIIEELRYREILREPPLTPRVFTDPAALDRLERVRRGIELKELVCQESA